MGQRPCRPIATGQRWYFRVTATILKTACIADGTAAGHRHRQTTPAGCTPTTHFMPGVFEITWNGKNYQAGRRLPAA
jgi:hypothetical protein